MKKITTLFIALICILFYSTSDAQLTCTETFTVSGFDDDPTVLLINASSISCNGPNAIISMKLTNSAGNLTSGFCSNNFSSWYGFDLSVDGGPITTGCAAEFDNYNITGFTSLTITSHDDDVYPDAVTITIDVEVTYVAPSCLSPTNLTATTITTTSADLGWTENGSATTWNIEWGAAGFTPGTGTVVSTGTNPHNLTGLTSSTSYDFYVQADCGADSSAWAGPYTFTTAFQCPGNAICGTYSSGDIASDLNFISLPGTSTCPGTISVVIPVGNIIDSVSTSYDMTGGIGWMSEQRSWLYSPSTSIGEPAMISGTGSSTGTLSYNRTGLTLANTASGTVDFELHAGRTWGGAGCDASYNKVDDGTWMVIAYYGLAPACSQPSVLTSSNITATSADLGWTENGSATTWNIEWGTAGFIQGAGTIVSTGTNPHNLTGLTSSTSYDFYVQADCGADSSAWTGPYTFNTPCSSVIAPWSEDFENSGLIPNCWNQGSLNSEDWLFGTTGGHVGNAGTIGGSTTSGNMFAWIDDSSPQSTGTTLESPYVDVSGLTTPSLYFYLISNNEGFSNVDFSVDVWDGASWNTGFFSSNANTLNGEWEQFVVNLSSLTITGDVQIRFIVDENNGTDFYDDIAIDDVEIKEGPSCFDPTVLNTSNLTTTSVDLGWTENGSATTWNIEWGAAGFTPGTGTIVSTGTNPYSLTGLNSNTSYDFNVQADCGADSSTWAGPFSFSTLCGPITSFPYFMDFENGFPCWTVENGGDPNAWGLWSGAGDHTTGSGICAGILYTSMAHDDHFISPGIPVTIGTSERYAFWAKNGLASYPDLCNVLVSTTGTAPGDFTDTLAANLVAPDVWTEYIYDLSVYDGDTIYVSIHAISADQYYLFVDDVMIDAYPSCPDPSALTTANISSNSAVLGWTENGPATAWNFEWDVAGFTQGMGNMDTTSSNPLTLTGLSANTSYDFYIQSDCGPGDSSTWVGPYNFTTTAEVVYVNEIHYDNTSTDSLEGIEIAGPAGTDLACYQLVLYNGSNGTAYNTTSLTGIIPDQQCGFGTIWFPITGVQNGDPDGIALYDTCTMSVVQFLSYEGTITAVDLPATGLISTDIGVSEPSSTPVGESLQLIGNGIVYSDFTWASSSANTYNLVNTDQVYCPSDGGVFAITEPTSGCSLSDSESVTVQIINYSLSTTIYSTDVSYSVNGGNPVSESISSSILPGDTLTYTFMSAADLSAPGTFSINAWVSLAGDTNMMNDSLIAYVVVSYPSPTIDAGVDATICKGTSALLTATGGFSYSWDNGVSDGVPFTPDSTTTYTVTGTDTNGCQGTATVTITVNTSPIVNAGADTTICNGASVTLSGSGASTYTWDNGVTDGVAFMPSTTTMYTVTGTDTSACQGTDSVTVTVNGLPTVDAGADTSICNGASVTLSGSGASTYTWDNGVTDGVAFMPSTTTMYTVTGTDTSACQGTDSVTVTVNDLPTVDAGADVSVCDGNNVTLSGTGASTYTWNNGISDGIAFTPSVNDTYIVTGTDVNGCTGTDSVDVKVNANPVSGFTYTSNGLDVSFTNSSSGAATYHWDFNDGFTGTDADPTHTYLSAGTYSVCLVAVSADNCSDTLCKDVVVNATGIADHQLFNNTNIYPNPSDGKVTVQIEGIKENTVTITIKNMLGQVILEELFTDLPIIFEQELDLSMAPIGVYFLSIETDTQRATQKLVIE